MLFGTIIPNQLFLKIIIEKLLMSSSFDDILKIVNPSENSTTESNPPVNPPEQPAVSANESSKIVPTTDFTMFVEKHGKTLQDMIDRIRDTYAKAIAGNAQNEPALAKARSSFNYHLFGGSKKNPITGLIMPGVKENPTKYVKEYPIQFDQGQLSRFKDSMENIAKFFGGNFNSDKTILGKAYIIAQKQGLDLTLPSELLQDSKAIIDKIDSTIPYGGYVTTTKLNTLAQDVKNFEKDKQDFLKNQVADANDKLDKFIKEQPKLVQKAVTEAKTVLAAENSNLKKALVEYNAERDAEQKGKMSLEQYINGLIVNNAFEVPEERLREGIENAIKNKLVDIPPEQIDTVIDRVYIGSIEQNQKLNEAVKKVGFNNLPKAIQQRLKKLQRTDVESRKYKLFKKIIPKDTSQEPARKISEFEDFYKHLNPLLLRGVVRLGRY